MGARRHAANKAPIRPPPPPGKIRLDGAFCGQIMCDLCVLDVALPLHGEVPAEGVGAALSTLAAAADDEDVGEKWRAVQHFLSELGTRPPGLASEDDQPIASEKPRIRNSDVPMQALVDELMSERDALKMESAKLREERDALTLERDALTSERDAVMVERDALKAERAKGAGPPITAKPPPRAMCGVPALSAMDPTVREQAVWIRGSFAGQVKTKGHFLDIALPLHGAVSGFHLSSAVRELAVAVAESAEPEVEPSKAGESNNILDASTRWQQLADILEEEYPVCAVGADKPYERFGRAPSAAWPGTTPAELPSLKPFCKSNTAFEDEVNRLSALFADRSSCASSPSCDLSSTAPSTSASAGPAVYSMETPRADRDKLLVDLAEIERLTHDLVSSGVL
mmetsp:Transcript_120368/g.347906  ORF Transcript_120368/g.347906 Transcript_120368/m.347906 type:complete len:398 (-) Transcript_120368:112-1305(-)